MKNNLQKLLPKEIWERICYWTIEPDKCYSKYQLQNHSYKFRNVCSYFADICDYLFLKNQRFLEQLEGKTNSLKCLLYKLPVYTGHMIRVMNRPSIFSITDLRRIYFANRWWEEMQFSSTDHDDDEEILVKIINTHIHCAIRYIKEGDKRLVITDTLYLFRKFRSYMNIVFFQTDLHSLNKFNSALPPDEFNSIITYSLLHDDANSFKNSSNFTIRCINKMFREGKYNILVYEKEEKI